MARDPGEALCIALWKLRPHDDVEIEVADGLVTLKDRVVTGHRASDLTDMAARVDGVQGVKSEIRTLAASSFDDELR